MSLFWIIISVVTVLALIGLVFELLPIDDDESHIQEVETTFWANKCHEAFNEAQRAYGLEDWYSFHKFCDQHALYYRRYKMARDGHFERKTE